ncbi:hypothetical protein BWI93_13145 [Siphonobacter sp. BAB-5385]|nr:hypothetical protein BWI93_13145 [Siphonobacter sp. BAB-5385]PMD88320.1 hypothetical protein BWI97_25390 [Siphonobacter sp. BAB-5405]
MLFQAFLGKCPRNTGFLLGMRALFLRKQGKTILSVIAEKQSKGLADGKPWYFPGLYRCRSGKYQVFTGELSKSQFYCSWPV